MQSVTSNAVAEGNFLSSGVKATTYYIVNVPIQSWTDIVYGNSQIGTGAYLFVLRLMDSGSWWVEYVSFVMYYWADGTNSNEASPITFNQCGHAVINPAYLSLRFLRRVDGVGSIQIYISQGANPVPVEVCIYKLGNAF